MSHATKAPQGVRGWQTSRKGGEWQVYERWITGLAWVCSHITKRRALRCIERRRALTTGEVAAKPTPTIKIDLEGNRS